MRARPFAVLAALAMLAGAIATTATAAPSAQALATAQSYWVPVGGRLTVQGHGFGHGHGMSQYGAEGAALQGLTAAQILAFYYPGTTTAHAGGDIRVLLGAAGSTLQVLPTAGLTLRDRGTGTTYPMPSPSGVRRWRLRVAPDHHAVVGYLTRHWHRWTPGGSLGTSGELVGDGEFFADGPLSLVTGSGTTSYRGILRAASPSNGSATRAVVNVVGLDDYVKGVVPSEMPASWQPAAVQAQAVAARTYAAFSRAAYRHRYYQICDYSACQVYRGVSGEDPRGNAAVDSTAGQVLDYRGAPAFTQFAASSGGWTSAGSVPYLPAQADPYDDFAGNPVHDWTTTIDARRLVGIYPSLGRLRRIEVVQRDGNGDWRGRVWSVVLDGTKANVTISGDTFRSIFGLRSDWFTIEPTPIIARYDRLGAGRSVLGRVRTREYAVAHGSAQTFTDGRIFYSRTTGAHELYQQLLAFYLGMDGPRSWLGLPTSGVQLRNGGHRAKFQGGVVWTEQATGTVAVPTPIAARYLRLGGTRSKLGWPVHENATLRGQRVTFEHGLIKFYADTGRTWLHYTG